MASNSSSLLSLLIILLFSLLSLTTHGDGATHKHFPTKKLIKEKTSHLHFYFHDIVSGPNPTAVPVARPSKLIGPGFGSVVMMDDPLTEGPEPGSKTVGRAQGMYASAGQQELGFLMLMNLAFTEGKYNGSVLTVVGRNQPLHPLREMPVVGGSGLFRFARGFAQAHTHWLDTKTGDAIVEYNVHVIHY